MHLDGAFRGRRQQAREARRPVGDLLVPILALPPLVFAGPDDVAEASKPPRFQLVSELRDDVEAPGFCGTQQRGCEPAFHVDRASSYPRKVWLGGCAGGRDVS